MLLFPSFREEFQRGVRDTDMGIIKNLQQFLPTSQMRWILLLTISIAGLIYTLPIPPIFDTKSYTESTIWTLRALLTVSTLLIGAVTLIILLVLHYRTVGTTIVNQEILDRDAIIIELKKKNSQLEYNLMLAYQENSVSTIESP